MREVQQLPQKTIQLERMKFQPFNGNIRKFPRFKEDFIKHIQPLCKREQAAFVLKSYLVDEVRDEVENIDEDTDAKWARLDKKYGNKGRLVD